MKRMIPNGIDHLVIIGAGGFGREVLDIVRALDDVVCDGFLDDGHVDPDLLAPLRATWLGPSDTPLPEGTTYTIGIGNGAVRQRIDGSMVGRGLQARTLRHPAATIGGANTIGAGAVLCAGARVTTNITFGRHVHINLNSTVGHDSTLEDYVTVFPGATISGNVRVGARSTIGTGANILPGVTIGTDCFVGAGAVVTKDVEQGTTVVGSPARPLARRD